MYSDVKGFPYIRRSTANNITLYKDTTIDGILTTGNTTINCDLTINDNLAYTGDDSYTNSEIGFRFKNRYKWKHHHKLEI